MKLAILTADELTALLETAVHSALAKTQAAEPPSDILSCEQVAALLGVHARTVRNLIQTEGLPPLRRIGKLWRFRRSEVLEWMKNRKRIA